MSSPPPPDRMYNAGPYAGPPPQVQPPYPTADYRYPSPPQSNVPPPYRQPNQRLPGAPATRPSFATTVTAAILALLLGVVFGGFCLISVFVLLGDAPDEAKLFAAGAVGGVVLVVGAVLMLLQKWAGFWVALVGAVLVVAGTFPLALAQFTTFRTNADQKSNLLFFVAAIFALIVILLELLPSTRRLLRYRAGAPGAPAPFSVGGPAVRPVTVAGQALGIAASVAGLVLGVVAIAVLPDVWDVARGGLVDKLPLFVQTLGVLLAVVGAVVAFGRKWAGALLLVIGGGTALLFVLIAVFRASSLDIGFTGGVYLMSSAGCVVLPLLPPARRYFGR